MKKRISDVLQAGKRTLEEAGIEDAAIDAWLLLEWITGMSRASYLAHSQDEMQEDKEKAYQDAIAERAKRIPLQHITKEQYFMGFPFYVNEHVLIPRQDTEILVEEGLKRVQAGDQILDLCTGSGCIAISMKKMAKESVSVTAADLSTKALAVAEKNAKELEAEIRFVQGDLFEAIEETYNMILSNPPYIPTDVIAGLQKEVKCFDPFMALDGKEDGLYFYKKIIKDSVRYLAAEGWLIFEIGHDQKDAVMQLLEEEQFTEIFAKKDLAGLDRVVGGRYIKR